MSNYTARTALSLALWDAGGEIEVEVIIKFTVSKPIMATDIDPATPAYAEVTSIVLRDEKTKSPLSCPAWIAERFSDDESFLDWLVEEAAEQDVSGREQAAEMRREDMEAF